MRQRNQRSSIVMMDERFTPGREEKPDAMRLPAQLVTTPPSASRMACAEVRPCTMSTIKPIQDTALITTPLGFGTGRLVGGALELSNVDLSQEFINMILTSTGYSAASRVITTTNDLINQLLVIGR